MALGRDGVDPRSRRSRMSLGVRITSPNFPPTHWREMLSSEMREKRGYRRGSRACVRKIIEFCHP